MLCLSCILPYNIALATPSTILSVMREIICIKRYNFKIKWEMCKGPLPLPLKMLYEFTTNSEDFTLEVTKILLFKIFT
jgi:hypothetical protein